jgi:hypothetical protein
MAAAATLMQEEHTVPATAEGSFLGIMVLVRNGTVLRIRQCVNQAEWPDVKNKTRRQQGSVHRYLGVVTQDPAVAVVFAGTVRHICSTRSQTGRKVHYDGYAEVACLSDPDVRSSGSTRLWLSDRSAKLSTESTHPWTVPDENSWFTSSRVVCMLGDTWMQQKALEGTEPSYRAGRTKVQSGGSDRALSELRWGG